MVVLTTISLAIVGCAIAGVFSQEFVRVFKKIIQIPGVKLILPLSLASLIVLYYQVWFFWGLRFLASLLYQIVWLLHQIVPFAKTAFFFEKVVLLVLISLIPSLIVYCRCRGREPLLYYYWTSFFIWLVAALLIVSFF